MRYEQEELKRRLVAGESLEVSTGGGRYEVWAEPYANPPTVFYEGRVFPYAELEQVIEAILEALQRGEVMCRWVEPWDTHVKACAEAHRAQAIANQEGRPSTHLSGGEMRHGGAGETG